MSIAIPSVGERVDELERTVAHLARQNAELAHMAASQGEILHRLLTSLGESAENLPGEHPIAPERQKRAKVS